MKQLFVFVALIGLVACSNETEAPQMPVDIEAPVNAQDSVPDSLKVAPIDTTSVAAVK
jgi:hypothetical protein